MKKYHLYITLSVTVEAHTTEEAMNIAHQFYNGATAENIMVQCSPLSENVPVELTTVK